MDELQPQPSLVGPVTQAERITSIDVLRGVAVLGILVMNIQSFSMVGAAYLNPTAYGDLSGANFAVWLSSHILADRKFMTIFSLLFGAGIMLMASRQEEGDGRARGVHYRRMTVLLLIGVLHGYLLWYGDILHCYAMCGMIVFLFRRKKPRTLIKLGVLSIALPSALAMLFHYSIPYWPPENVEEVSKFWNPSTETTAKELAVYRGGWIGQLPARATMAVFFQTFIFLIENAWRAGGLMLVGMGLFKLDFFSAKRSTAAYAKTVAIAVVVGVPLICLGVYRNFAAGWAFERSFYLGAQFNYWGSLPVALGWVGLVMLLCKLEIVPVVTRGLAAVGRMAFTNYLLQTVICTTLFYGHGFGLFGQLPRTQQILVVVAVWAVLIALSNVWLRVYRFGPAEWMWRSLSYWKPQPMRRAGEV